MTTLAKNNKEGSRMLTDILGCIGEIENCLEKAWSNQAACLRGIEAADEALKQTSDDPDVKSNIRIKRAQLLYIAAEKKYSSSQLKDPISRCIEDCEQVCACTTSNEFLNIEARKLIDQARQLQEIRKMDSHPPITNKGESYRKFDPRRTCFANISNINAKLLQDVVTNYKRVQRICRMCYYTHRRREPLVYPNRCKNCSSTGVIRLIPASKMCSNELNLDWIPVPPAPTSFMQHPNQPFEHCKKDGHPKCFEKSATNDIWYSHSIEELVIWTIERHYGCTFDEYIKQYHNNKGIEFPREFPQQEMDITSEFAYHPNKLLFKNPAAIPRDLLLDVVTNYMDSTEYCKWCFYRHAKTVKPVPGESKCSSCGAGWEPVVVIKSCDQCWNFGDFDRLPIAPWPRSKPHPTPFEYCQKDDHYRCFKVYSLDEFWYAHSVEELVVWTVEREYGLPFGECIQRYLKSQLKNIPRGPSSGQMLQTTSSQSLQSPNEGPLSATNPVPPSYQTFHLSSCQFSKVDEIPLVLLEEVARSYQERMLVCRACFYSERRISYQNGNSCDGPESAHVWTRPLLVMPSSHLCDNTPCFGEGEYISVPPLPLVATLKPCPNTNHRPCFVGCLNKIDEMFAHSVEALVVWIVESEFGNFEEYIHRRMSEGSLVAYDQQTPKNIYFPESVKFPNVKSIPQDLLAAVAKCFNNRRTVCRLCYFDSNQKRLSKKSITVRSACEKGHLWTPLCVIPCCNMCAGPGEWVAIFPYPRHMKESRASFAMCKKPDGHSSCFEMVRGEDPWFPHTVEEMVIWTVERERGASFESIYKEFLQDEYNETSAVDHHYDDQLPGYEPDSGYAYDPSYLSDDRHHSEDDQSNAGVQAHDPLQEIMNKLLTGLTSQETSLPLLNEAHTNSDSAGFNGVGLDYDTLFPALTNPEFSLAGGVTSNVSQSLLSQVNPNSNSLPDGLQFSSPSSFLSQPDQPSTWLRHPTDPTRLSQPQPQPEGNPVGTRHQKPSSHETKSYSEDLVELGSTLRNGFLSQDSQHDSEFGGIEGKPLSQDSKLDTSSVASLPRHETSSHSLSPSMGRVVLHAMATASTEDQGFMPKSDETELWVCLLCYQGFQSPDELAEHCQDEAHVSAVVKDCCYTTIWKYHPPPFDMTVSQFAMCTRPEVCKNKLECRKAHSEDEFIEWGNRYQHRRRKTADKENPLNIQPQGVGVILPVNEDTECGLKLFLLGQPKDIWVTSGKEFSWQLTLEGQNWQTLFGIVCTCEPNCTFTVAKIEGDTFVAKQPKKPEWKAKSVGQAMLLGKVSITLKAVVTIAGDYQCSVNFHLGFQQHFCLNLSIHIGTQPLKGTLLPKNSSLIPSEPVHQHQLVESQTQVVQTSQVEPNRSYQPPTEAKNDPLQKEQLQLTGQQTLPSAYSVPISFSQNNSQSVPKDSGQNTTVPHLVASDKELVKDGAALNVQPEIESHTPVRKLTTEPKETSATPKGGTTTVQDQVPPIIASKKATTERPKVHKSFVDMEWAQGIGLVAEDDTLLKYTQDAFFDNLIASLIK